MTEISGSDREKYSHPRSIVDPQYIRLFSLHTGTLQNKQTNTQTNKKKTLFQTYTIPVGSKKVRWTITVISLTLFQNLTKKNKTKTTKNVFFNNYLNIF